MKPRTTTDEQYHNITARRGKGVVDLLSNVVSNCFLVVRTSATLCTWPVPNQSYLVSIHQEERNAGHPLTRGSGS